MRKLAAFVALLCCIAVLAGCTPTPVEEEPAGIKNADALSSKYPIQTMTIDGVGIGDYVIVSKAGSYTTTATFLRDAIADATGHVLEIKSPNEVAAEGHAIVLCDSGYGNSATYTGAKDDYGIASDGKSVYLWGGSDADQIYAAKQFIYTVVGYNTKLGTAAASEVELKELNVTGKREASVISGDEEFFTISTKVMATDGPFAEGLTYNTQQGACTDGEYAYFCLLDKATDTAGCSIFKYDMSDWSLVNVNYNVQVGHGNSICYVESRDQLMVVDYSSTMTVHYLNKDTLKIEESKYVPMEIYCATYNATKDQYVFGLKSAKRFVITDSNWNAVGASDIASLSTDQSVYCDDNYIYFVYSDPNIILVYDWDCNLVNTISLDVSVEPESLFFKDGVLYVAYYIYNGQGGELYVTEII